MKKWLIALLIIVALIGAGWLYILNLQARWDRETQFRAAIENSDLKTAENLLKEGVNIDASNKVGRNALTSSIDSGNFALVKFLIEHGAKSAWDGTALDYAIFSYLGMAESSSLKLRKKEILLYLANLKIPNKKELPILTAIIIENFDEVKKILSTSDIKKFTDYDLYNIRQAAIMTNNIEILDYILKAIPSLADLKFERWTFLLQAIDSNNPAMVAYALKLTNPNINEGIEKKQDTPFQKAIYNGNLAIIEILIKNGAQLDENYYEIGSSPKEIAFKTNNQKALELLEKYSNKK